MLECWIQPIGNHLYWLAATGQGDSELILSMWKSILNHVCDVHTGHDGPFAECLHEPLENRQWIKPCKLSSKNLPLTGYARGMCCRSTRVCTKWLCCQTALTCSSSGIGLALYQLYFLSFLRLQMPQKKENTRSVYMPPL